jgi:hypothetical protein
MRTCFHKLALASSLLVSAWLIAVPARPSDGGSAPPSDEVELKTIHYRDLCAAVRAQRGKVVVVDIWGEY